MRTLDTNPTTSRTSSDVARVAIEAVVNLAKKWKLRDRETADLMGVAPRTWSRMKKAEWSGALNQDQLMRASALIGVYKALHLYFSDDLADRWPRMPNEGPLFRGEAPTQTMLDGGLPAILNVRQYVDALRGGL